ncbi:hypothetical protein HPB49_008999 [Dermacentor silvarum]|uniref:Uncharacterized protein n=1 Tax=Dermacentor silvarum TaxID=543639 RepID=A0ACB8DC53_DERSI|nr:hypothetical protein HPB49_008999 [Dermacentor silvarum]
MTCSLEKSPYIRIRSKYAHRTTGTRSELALYGMPLEETTQLRVRCGHARSVGQRWRANDGMARSRDGMREMDTLRIVQAFVVSRRTYALPYQLMRKWQTDQANILLRRPYKTSLGLPVERRFILERLGYPLIPEYISGAREIINKASEYKIRITPIRKDMQPRPDADRGALRRQYQHYPNTYYTDAISIHGGNYCTIAILVATVKTRSVTTEKTVSIAMAIDDAGRKEIPAHVLRDSEAACRACLKGILPAAAARLKKTAPTAPRHHVKRGDRLRRSSSKQPSGGLDPRISSNERITGHLTGDPCPPD